MRARKLGNPLYMGHNTPQKRKSSPKPVLTAKVFNTDQKEVDDSYTYAGDLHSTRISMEQIEELEKKINQKKKSFEVFQENQQPRLSLLMSRVEKLENSILRHSQQKKQEQQQLSTKKAFQNMTMPSDISKASESCFFSRIQDSSNRPSLVKELDQESEQDLKISDEIQGIENLVKFYFDRVKEGCWLTEDLQTLILEKLQKCQQIAEKSKKKQLETPLKDSLFEEKEEEEEGTFQKLTLGRKRAKGPEEEFSAACSSFNLGSKRQKKN